MTATSTVTVASATRFVGERGPVEHRSRRDEQTAGNEYGRSGMTWSRTRLRIVNAFQSAGITQVRWPGGSDSDLYHWSSNTACADIHGTAPTSDSNDTFTNFVSELAKPANLDVALTANFGSNSTCTAGGEPSEAAAWATAALAAGITPSHMTVGNEEYGNWEEDSPLNDTNDPTLYSSAVVGSSGYYNLIKGASPSTLVGIDVDADNRPTAGTTP